MRLDFDSLSGMSGAAKDSFFIAEIKRLKAELDLKERMVRDLRGQAGKPQIASRFGRKSDAAPPIRGEFDNGDPTLAAAAKAFKEAKFADALSLLRSIPPEDDRQKQVVQMLPYALFYDEDFQTAIPAFEDLLLKDRFAKTEDVQWFLSLCYVATGEKTKMQYHLRSILRDPRHDHYQEAVELQKGLNVE
jgi:hypothetical protein